ncbi:hypothetical protein SADUNF_Sadunf01G0007100 [Salix dunnii]|uniref:Uncharacterized protein n=1 Tax=Salix dunnii TaxID=1413687 RepID=A0A835TJC4_9ROSI|nr:hypothetical protein SADUNF_Sadunf01G0007100 [Salix dunnii]
MENSHLGITLLSLFLFFSLPKSTLSQDPPLTVFEILQKYGLPGGLLPNTVKSYSLSDDGSFTVYLEKECHVEFDYLVNYEKIITGKLGYGSITNLKGIQVQKFFLWLDVDEIKVDLPPSDSIYFQVGWINKKLDADQFKTVHSCRAGVSHGSLGGLWKQFLEMDAYIFQIYWIIMYWKGLKSLMGPLEAAVAAVTAPSSPVHAPHRHIALPMRAGVLALARGT